MIELKLPKAMDSPEYRSAEEEIQELNTQIASLHAENSSLCRTIESLRASVRELAGVLKGSAAQNALQRAKDLLQ